MRPFGLVVYRQAVGVPNMKVGGDLGEKKGFQDSPDVPLCGLPIGILG